MLTLQRIAAGARALSSGDGCCTSSSAQISCKLGIQAARLQGRRSRDRKHFTVLSAANPVPERERAECKSNASEEDSRSGWDEVEEMAGEGSPGTAHEVRARGSGTDTEQAKHRVYAPARRAARRILTGRLRGEDILEAAKAAGLQVGARAMNVLMHELGNLNDFDGAVEAFKVFRAAGVDPNYIVCSTLIFILGKGRRFPEAQQLFRWTLRRVPGPPTPDFFHTFMIACAKCRNPGAAAQAFAELEQRGMVPGRTAYMGVVSAYLSGGEREQAEAWLARMRDGGIELVCSDYEAMLAACARARRAQDASAIFREMQERGVEASDVSHHALLSAYDRCDQWRDALRVLVCMREPGQVAWSTALSACARAGQAGAAEDVLAEMQARGCAPSVVAWSCLVEAYRRAGDWRGAESAVEAMMAAGVAPNEVTWCSLMECYAAAGEAGRAGRALERVARPGVVVWTAAIASVREPEKARAFFKGMRDARCEPNVATFSALMKVCGDAGEWQQAEAAFQEMVHSGVRPNAIACATLMRAYAKAKQLGRAGALLRRMTRLYGVEPDKFVYTALLRACSLCGDWERAEAVFAHMQAVGVQLDGVVFQEMMRTYEAHGQIDKSVRLMDAMASGLS